MISGLFKIFPTNYSFTNHNLIYIYIYKQDLALNNLYVLICYKTQSANQLKWLYTSTSMYNKRWIWNN